MKTQPHNHQNQQPPPPPPKLKPLHRPFFSCSFFRHCTTQSTLSPTNPHPPPLPISSSFHNPPPTQQYQTEAPTLLAIAPIHQYQPHLQKAPTSRNPDSESSSSSTSQSFTQWRFPSTFPHPLSPGEPQPPLSLDSNVPSQSHSPPSPPLPPSPTSQKPSTPVQIDILELFHIAELQFTDGSEMDRIAALHMLEHSIVPNPQSSTTSTNDTVIPVTVMDGIISFIKQKPISRPATKVLLALCLSHHNRLVAVERGAAGKVVEALADLEGSAAERALAALDLMCTVVEGAAEVRAHALAVPMLVQVMAKMEGRGREYAISVLSVIYGGNGRRQQGGDGSSSTVKNNCVGASAPPEQVARAVVLAMQGESCSARGKRKGGQLLKALQEISDGRLDLAHAGR